MPACNNFVLLLFKVLFLLINSIFSLEKKAYFVGIELVTRELKDKSVVRLVTLKTSVGLQN